MSLHRQKEERRDINKGNISVESFTSLLRSQPYLERISISERDGYTVIVVPKGHTPLGTTLKAYAVDTIAHHIGASCSTVDDEHLGPRFIVRFPEGRPLTVLVKEEESVATLPLLEPRTMAIRRALVEQRIEPQSITFLDYESCVLVTLKRPNEMFRVLILLENELGFVQSKVDDALYFSPPTNSEWLPVKLVLRNPKRG